jgi:dUTP pyrophosphatase
MTTWLNYQYVGDRGEPAHRPFYATEGAAGFDLAADVALWLPRLGVVTVATGYAFEIPPGCEGQVRGRSGLAGKGIFAHAGTIDSDYRGEVMVILYNLSGGKYQIERGQRIAQMVISQVCQVKLRPAGELVGTRRGSNGLGSTGV